MVAIDYFDTAVEQFGDRPALIDGDKTLTFNELATLTHRLASTLTPTMSHPSPCAVFAPNDYRVLIAYIAVMRAGGVVFPIHAENPIATCRALFDSARPSVCFYHRGAMAAVRTLKATSPYVEQWIAFDDSIEGDLRFDEMLANTLTHDSAWIDAEGNHQRPVFYWPTSGTTGEPKIVIEDTGTFDVALRFSRLSRHAPERSHVSLAVTPVSHGAGAVAFGTLSLGGTAIMMRRFDASQVFELVEKHSVTDLWLSPTALYLLLDIAKVRSWNMSSLRSVRLGMAAVAPERLRQAVSVFGPIVSQTYGQIETGFVTALDPQVCASAAAGSHERRLLSSGRSAFVNRFTILNSDGNAVGPGEVGEIAVRGRGVKRYLQDDATREARRSGWHATGDLGYVDDDGYLYVTGRLRDVVNMGGFKLSSWEAEQTIMSMDDVLECAVVPLKDDVRGEVAVAIVVPRSGRTLRDGAVAEHCRPLLGRRTPSRIVVWPSLPKTPVGKIDKRTIQDMLAAGATDL